MISAVRIAGLAGLLLLAACARPLGDFDRPAPDPIHDSAMPAIGSIRASLNGEPVSSFNKSDEEVEMANRIWRFVTSGRTKDWFADVAAEMHRTRLTFGTGMLAGPPDRYYKWLHGTTYQSAAVRYASITADVDADIATVPNTFASICRVREIDHERVIAAANLPVGPGSHADAAARAAENDEQIGWFARALRYRYKSYSFALDHLLVETPNAAAKEVDAHLAVLEDRVSAAERGNFCASGDGPIVEEPGPGNPHPAPIIPSRFATSLQ